MVSPRWALLSVYDKEGVEDLAQELLEWDFRLVASRGTAAYLQEHHLDARPVEEMTGWGEMLEGRIKTLHPRLLAGILGRRDRAEDRRELTTQEIPFIEVVAVHLYPFEEAVAAGAAGAEALDMVDVGGIALVRAAAKNWPHVSVLTDPDQYPAFIDALRAGAGEIPAETRLRLARDAFARTSRYDAAIYNHLAGTEDPFPPELRLAYTHAWPLRYGENPYQEAVFYRDPAFQGSSVAAAEELTGRGLSFNNILDLDTALELVMKFDRPTAAVVKHAAACGVASHDDLASAYRDARATDPKSAYGSVLGFNRPVDEAVARAMKPHFVEGVIAPDFDEGALEILRGKKKLRALRTGRPVAWEPSTHALGVRGGLLVQTREYVRLGPGDLKVVTDRAPTEAQVASMLFAYRVLGHLKSNAIVLAKGERTVGLCGGQPSRVDAVIVAGQKAGPESRGSVLASDAFFPFPDGIEEAAKAGVEAILQPGGSIRDGEVIAAAEARDLAMVFTGVRVFKH